MFLMELETPEKFAFLQLAHYIARVDGEFALNEAKVIRNYCDEMGIDEVPFNEERFDLETCLKTFATEKSRRVLLLELMVLVHSDDRFDRYQHQLVDKIACTFGVKEEEVYLFSQWGKVVSACYAQGRAFLGVPPLGL